MLCLAVLGEERAPDGEGGNQSERGDVVEDFADFAETALSLLELEFF